MTSFRRSAAIVKCASLAMAVLLLTLPRQTAGQAKAGSLTILEAKYGFESNVVDVTSILAAKVKDDRLILPVWPPFVSNGADPAFGKQKTLNVKYKIGDAEQQISVLDEGVLLLVSPVTTVKVQGLVILEAKYGSIDKWADVTLALRDAVRNSKLSVRVDAGPLTRGKDPFPNHRKLLYVIYTWRGVQYAAMQAEGGMLMIEPPADAPKGLTPEPAKPLPAPPKPGKDPEQDNATYAYEPTGEIKGSFLEAAKILNISTEQRAKLDAAIAELDKTDAAWARENDAKLTGVRTALIAADAAKNQALVDKLSQEQSALWEERDKLHERAEAKLNEIFTDEQHRQWQTAKAMESFERMAKRYQLTLTAAQTKSAAEVAAKGFATLTAKTPKPKRIQMGFETWSTMELSVLTDAQLEAMNAADKKEGFKGSPRRRTKPAGTGDLAVVPPTPTPSPNPAPTNPAQAGDIGKGYIVIPVRGIIGHHFTDDLLALCLKEAAGKEIGAVVLEINSQGGLTSELDKITKRLVAFQSDSGKRLIAYVKPTAHSAAAIMAIACKDIVMAPVSTIGATTEVGDFLWGAIKLKRESITQAGDRALAQFAGHDPALVEAMSNSSVELWMAANPQGPPAFATSAGLTSASPLPRGTLVKSRGKVLTLTADDAAKYGLSRGVAKDAANIGAVVALAPWTEVDEKPRKLAQSAFQLSDAVEKDLARIGEMADKALTSPRPTSVVIANRQLGESKGARTAVSRIAQITAKSPYFNSVIDRDSIEFLTRRLDARIKYLQDYINSEKK